MRFPTLDIVKALDWKSSKSGSLVLIVLSLGWVLLAGLVHYLTGPQYEFHLIFLLPVLVNCWYISLRAGALAMLLSASVWMLADLLVTPYANDFQILLVNEAFRLIVFSIVLVMVDRLRRAFERESRLARLDALTQLPNRRDLYEHGGAEIARARRYGHSITMISLDLDNFKFVNDRDGHDAGDRVLCTVADTLRKNIRSMDIAARTGGDEFIVLLPEAGHEAASEIAAKLQQKLTHAMQEKAWPVSGSFGVVTFYTPPTSLDELVKRADQQLYEAKQSGKNAICHEVIRS
jgi:diguanylate cyclase (GGDEF)-like protein